MMTLMFEAMREYQFVLIDAPPLLNVTDGRILATMVDGALLGRQGRVTRRRNWRSRRNCTFATLALI